MIEERNPMITAVLVVTPSVALLTLVTLLMNL